MLYYIEAKAVYQTRRQPKPRLGDSQKAIFLEDWESIEKVACGHFDETANLIILVERFTTRGAVTAWTSPAPPGALRLKPWHWELCNSWEEETTLIRDTRICIWRYLNGNGYYLRFWNENKFWKFNRLAQRDKKTASFFCQHSFDRTVTVMVAQSRWCDLRIETGDTVTQVRPSNPALQTRTVVTWLPWPRRRIDVPAYPMLSLALPSFVRAVFIELILVIVDTDS